MATLPKPQDLALEILAVLLRDGNHRPGDGMKGTFLRNGFGLTRPPEDFEAGITYALAQKWIEMGQNGFVLLTPAGFSAGGGVLPGADELARDVLKALLNDGARPGRGGARLMPLRHRFGIERPGTDYEAGITYAQAQKWIEIDPNGFVTFTEAGFAEA